MLMLATVWTGGLALAQEQNVRYFNKNHQVADKADADHYEVLEVFSDSSAVVKAYTIGDTLLNERHYRDFHKNENGKKIRHGIFRNWYTNGQLAREGNYRNNKPEGQHTVWYKNGQKRFVEFYVNGELQDTLKSFYENGTLRRLELYETGKVLKGEVYAEDGKVLPYFPANQMPEFPGGVEQLMKFLVANMKYPRTAQKEKASGQVLTSFIVDKDGTIEDVTIVKGVHPDIDAEALRVVRSMPKWKPGMQNDEVVRVRYNLPLKFAL